MRNLCTSKSRLASVVAATVFGTSLSSAAFAQAGPIGHYVFSGTASAASSVVASVNPPTGLWLLKLGAGAVVTIAAINNLSAKTRVELRHEGTNETTILEVPTKRIEEFGARVNDPLTVHPTDGGVELKHIGRDFAFVLDGRGKPLLESTRRVRPYHR